ncbi:MAG: outer membrane beta-barrel protein [Sphingobacteriales bacterium]|nr:outer membrane beta-barrel protein [Sphingobacteriales bacterium]
MKKLFLLSVCTLSFTAMAFAQTKKTAPMPPKGPMVKSEMMTMNSPTQKGKWLVGANIGFNSFKGEVAGVEEQKSNNLLVQPAVSYFIKDDLAVGLVLGVGSRNRQLAGVDDQKISSLSVAPSVRYYMPIGNRVKFYGQLLVPIGSEKVTLDAGVAVDVKTQTMGVNLIPGFAFFPSQKISIELNLGSIYFQSAKTGDEKLTNMGINMLGEDIYSKSDNFNNYNPATIGIKFHLGK